MNFTSPVRSRGSQSSTSSRSPLERRECLRGVLDRTKNMNTVGPKSMKNLDEIVKEADTISSEAPIDEKVNNHDEVLMDSEVMAASSRLVKTSSSTLTEDLSGYNLMEFAERLVYGNFNVLSVKAFRRLMNYVLQKQYVFTTPDETQDLPNWTKLENELPQLFRRTANYTEISGCLEPPEPKPVVERQPVRRQRDALAPIERPDAIVEVEKTDRSLEETVSMIKDLISNHQKTTGAPLEFFRLILDPNDYGKTVENMLHVSFLVRDGIMQMMLDNHGNPVIQRTTKEMRSEFKQAQGKGNIQNIISLSYQQWQTLVADLGVEVPMINFQ